MVPWHVTQSALTAMNFITAFLVTVPLYWHLEAINVGCILLIFWVGLSSLISGINCVIWRNNAIVIAPIWGDFTVHFQFIASQGIIAAGMVIARRLNKIASTSSVSTSRSDKRKQILIDVAFGMTSPMVLLIFMWFLQGHRFDILEGIGPVPVIPNTYIAQIVIHGLELLVGLMGAMYNAMTLRIFLRRRKQFNELLASNSNLSFNRYMRLMALCCCDIFCTIPLVIFLIVFDRTVNPIYVWKGLADLHSGFDRIGQWPALLWTAPSGSIWINTCQNWFTIIYGLLFFCFFGLAEEARTHYRLAFTTIAKKLGYSTAGSSLESSTGFPTKGSKLGVTIPSFIQRSTNRRSITSFSDKVSIGDFDTFDDLEKNMYSPAETVSSSSDSILTPIDGVRVHQQQEVKVDFPEDLHIREERTRPDSDIVIAPRRSPDPDVPSSIRDSGHLA
ncbi:putative fungal pheromoneG-protein-coupled receptor [Irpex rosettiformis]|uniref:Fungal pheromoneG-protein-coupled receptor n=1 Tax=Irpex rosettiformis TaxID=378272 RepID=A0ACB8U2E2_9APHY|nr:putative fungal pheromoneG-protein-coupled receptor [Irpex rosettiformis]